MDGIKSIQPNYIYKVNPVNLFENRKQNDMFGQSEFNLNHPKAGGDGVRANNLDFLA